MTREEAIDILNDERIVIWTEPDEEEIARKQNEAIDMAIESLSANCTTEKPNDEVEQGNDVVDYISRADAMGSVQDHFNDDGFKGYDDGQKMLDRIKSLPSADRPAKLLKDGTLKVNAQNGAEVNRVLVWGDDGCGGLYYADDRLSGEWVIEDAHTEHCSVCGYAFHISALFAVGGNDEPNFCPNCGARMKGGVE